MMGLPQDYNDFVGHDDGSVSYRRNGQWFKRVWAVPYEHIRAFPEWEHSAFQKHVEVYGWTLKSRGDWYYAAPDHLAGRVDSSG